MLASTTIAQTTVNTSFSTSDNDPCGEPQPAAATGYCLRSCLRYSTRAALAHHSDPFQVLCNCVTFFSSLSPALPQSLRIGRARANFTRCSQACSCSMVAGGELCTSTGCCRPGFRYRARQNKNQPKPGATTPTTASADIHIPSRYPDCDHY